MLYLKEAILECGLNSGKGRTRAIEDCVISIEVNE